MIRPVQRARLQTRPIDCPRAGGVGTLSPGTYQFKIEGFQVPITPIEETVHLEIDSSSGGSRVAGLDALFVADWPDVYELGQDPVNVPGQGMIGFDSAQGGSTQPVPAGLSLPHLRLPGAVVGPTTWGREGQAAHRRQPVLVPAAFLVSGGTGESMDLSRFGPADPELRSPRSGTRPLEPDGRHSLRQRGGLNLPRPGWPLTTSFTTREVAGASGPGVQHPRGRLGRHHGFLCQAGHGPAVDPTGGDLRPQHKRLGLRLGRRRRADGVLVKRPIAGR